MRTWLRRRFPVRPPSVIKARLSPPLALLGSFLGLIVIGTLLLKMPVSTHVPIDWLQALFTATSAVTVTGLSVVDTGSHFTLTGQWILLLLIEAGGIGIMTFAAATLLAIGHRLGLGEQQLIRDSMNYTRFSDLGWLIRRIVVMVVVVQALGAGLLMLIWVPALGWGQGAFHSLFYAVSSFNNAGFALSADSLTGWGGHWGVVAIITLLVIVGGLGFTVLADLGKQRRWSQLTLHSKMMLVGTGGLLLFSLVFFLLAEWNNPATLAGLPWYERLPVAWFQAVTPRTAGFNVVDVASLTLPVTVLYLLLMFIGAGTNSTGSGIKVTTFMVLVLATRAFLRGRPLPSLFGRQISAQLVYKALAVALIASVLVFVALMALTFTDGRLGLENLLFEVVSAFGTVGLSRGITTELSTPGQLIIMLTMFLGRVGPLTLAFLLTRPHQPVVRYPEGEVHIG
ncbi:MAG: Ktr system potassium transporter B [Pseudomonadales bacterium]|uniref:TrkH family potassium uptake protein n=1 Tax=Alcanivorax sp. MD8A TaxID=1177157 RepID=UPI000C9C1E41|nr:potassium transporter TrkG [Alcanivorax sp. MD8A]MCG8439129.1 Ktr system potassium transporter B [Pseudomonadales bacterium]MED5432666.1 potassium transporter TrkG [Pseudomonadota bacterium]PNE01984.1 TrkH family potassium uptake protein [Alcanivorax sp. MD8A]